MTTIEMKTNEVYFNSTSVQHFFKKDGKLFMRLFKTNNEAYCFDTQEIKYFADHEPVIPLVTKIVLNYKTFPY